MKRTLIIIGAGALVGLIVGLAFAQGIGPRVSIVIGGAAGDHTHCGPVSAAGTSNLCQATDGMWLSVNGGAYVQLGSSSPVVPVQVQINNQAKVCNPLCGFTIAATASAPNVGLAVQ